MNVVENYEHCYSKQDNEDFNNKYSTPVKPKLEKFNGFYSPEHLNKTPKQNFMDTLICPKGRCIYDHVEDFKCRTSVKCKRRNDLHNNSFEFNQSLPAVRRKSLYSIMMDYNIPKLKSSLDLVRVDGSNGLRFNTSLASSEPSGSPVQNQLDRFLQNANNAKAVFTIDPETADIMIVNNKACSLLGFSSSELCSLNFCHILRDRGGTFSLGLSEGGDVVDEGPIVLMSGKVVDLFTKKGTTVQVSLWIRKLDNKSPCLVVAEPVRCKHAAFTVDAETNLILRCEGADAALLFGADNNDKLLGLKISTLIPSIKLPSPSDTDLTVKQKATGRTLDGSSFPLCLWLSIPEDSVVRHVGLKHQIPIIEVYVRVTFNVSGLLVVDDSGAITACNHHFAMLTFGKSQAELVGRHIEEVIQGFCNDADIIKEVSKDDSVSDTDDSCDVLNPSHKSQCVSLNMQNLSPTKEKSVSLVTHSPTPTQDMISSLSTTEQRNELPDITSGLSGISMDEEAYCLSSISKSRSENLLRSESRHSRASESLNSEQEVTPIGRDVRAKVNDPMARLSLDSSKYRLKNIGFKEDRSSLSLDFCDSDETSADFLTPINELPPGGCEIEQLPKQNGNNTLVDSWSTELDLQVDAAASRKTLEGEWPELGQLTSTPRPAAPAPRPSPGVYHGVVTHSDGTLLNVVYTVSEMRVTGSRAWCVWLGVRLDSAPRHATLVSSLTTTTDDDQANKSQSVSTTSFEEQIFGEYNKYYATVKQIGKGAYGCVRLTYRRVDRLLTVTKFILKEKVGAQFWVEEPDGRRVPLELSLLLSLKHPNIVSVMEAFENEKYFQMVMERHGSGMDLFEFVERRPCMDEPLISYIFRQVGNAVQYLHSLNILHRDIKDENIIIDNKFHVKLIDFGSAAFMKEDSLFSTFYGTTEYCSPEVLAGNKYQGPELEMWSMGITLYVLAFLVNPFSDIEDTIQGELNFPRYISSDFEHLLKWMLCKDPQYRCSIEELLEHPWIRQPVNPADYVFHEVVSCDPHEANPEVYYSNSLTSPKSDSPLSTGDQLPKDGLSRVSACAGSAGSGARLAAPAPPRSANCSPRSSTDLVETSKPLSEAGLTDMSSDATGHAAADIDPDPYDCDTWDECEQDSFS